MIKALLVMDFMRKRRSKVVVCILITFLLYRVLLHFQIVNSNSVDLSFDKPTEIEERLFHKKSELPLSKDPIIFVPTLPTQKVSSFEEPYEHKQRTFELYEASPEETINLKCSCQNKTRKASRYTDDTDDKSWCSGFSNARGYGQKVVSYILYNSSENSRQRYLFSLLKTSEEVKKLLPGWIIRIYVDVYKYTAGTVDHPLCIFHCLHPHVDICNVNFLPSPVDKIEHKKLWRIIPMLDPLVNTMLSRDADSPVIKREISALHEWFNSTWMFHGMRDHPMHSAAVMAGMWGVKTWMNRIFCQDLATKIFLNHHAQSDQSDQSILYATLWPKARKYMLCHDSYKCLVRPFRCGRTKPFPTRRLKGSFIGNLRNNRNLEEYLLAHECPVSCRPIKHKDWTFC